MGQRLDLDDILRTILGSGNVYFQAPPENTMQYPCIVYEREGADTKYSDNGVHTFIFRYQVTLIAQNPNSEDVIKAIAALPMCSYDRFFRVNNLNHDVFNLYF